MKEIIRRSLQKFFQVGTSGSEAVCLWCLNKTTMQLLPGIIKSGRKVVFLPNFKGRKFDSEYSMSIPDKLLFDMATSIGKFFIKHRVKYYVFDKLPVNDLCYHSALGVANCLGGVKILYLDHGDSAQENFSNEYMWLDLVDYYYARDLDMRDYLRSIANEYSINVKVSTWKPQPVFYNKRTDEKLLMVAPAFHCRETFGTCYSDTFKYRVRRTMLLALDTIAEKYDLKILWKYMVGEEGYDPVPDLIKLHKTTRVVYENRNNFDYWLARANMFVSDCASTTLYDATKMGINSLALWNSKLPEIRKSAKEMFGESIFIYDDTEGIVTGLVAFVDKCMKKEWVIPTISTRQDRYPWE